MEWVFVRTNLPECLRVDGFLKEFSLTLSDRKEAGLNMAVLQTFKQNFKNNLYFLFVFFIYMCAISFKHASIVKKKLSCTAHE